MDMKMVDNEDQRDDRKKVPINGLNRITRRKLAKADRVFRKKGLWKHLSREHRKRSGHTDNDKD